MRVDSAGREARARVGMGFWLARAVRNGLESDPDSRKPLHVCLQFVKKIASGPPSGLIQTDVGWFPPSVQRDPNKLNQGEGRDCGRVQAHRGGSFFT